MMLKSTGRQARVLAHPKYFMQADPGEGWGRIIGEVVGDGEFTVKNPKKPGKVQSILLM